MLKTLKIFDYIDYNPWIYSSTSVCFKMRKIWIKKVINMVEVTFPEDEDCNKEDQFL